MHVFHILKKGEWANNVLTAYQPASLETQGFIHCCTQTQIPKVVSKWFPVDEDLLLMEIDAEVLHSKLVYENLEAGKELFPHIYGPINLEAIIQVKEFPRSTQPEVPRRQMIPIEQFIARSHFIFDEGWFLLTSGDYHQEKFNCMTISWGMLGTLWSLPAAMVAVRFSRYTFRFMDEYDSFSLNAFPTQYRDVLNELGSDTGREMDKINFPKITPMACQNIPSPCYQEAELVLECKKIYWEDMNPAHFLDGRIFEKYPKPDYHRFFIGEVVGIYGIQNYLYKNQDLTKKSMLKSI